MAGSPCRSRVIADTIFIAQECLPAAVYSLIMSAAAMKKGDAALGNRSGRHRDRLLRNDRKSDESLLMTTDKTNRFSFTV